MKFLAFLFLVLLVPTPAFACIGNNGLADITLLFWFVLIFSLPLYALKQRLSKNSPKKLNRNLIFANIIAVLILTAILASKVFGLKCASQISITANNFRSDTGRKAQEDYLREQVLLALDHPSTVRLYSIKPKYDPQRYTDVSYLDKDRVLGHLDLIGDRKKQVLDNFRSAIVSGSNELSHRGLDDWCSPHHVLHIVSDKATYDLLPCSIMKTLEVSPVGTGYSNGYLNFPGDINEKLDALLTAEKIPLAQDH